MHELAWWYAPHIAHAGAPFEDDDMVTADTPRKRLNVLLNRAAPMLGDIHPMAPLLLGQVQFALAGMDNDVIVEQARRIRDVTSYIIAGGDLPAWLP